MVKSTPLDGQVVLYVGRTRRSLRRRISEFYKHKYGDRRPHRGGQEVIPFAAELYVYWAATEEPALAENLMIERFRHLVGRIPYANRIRASTEVAKLKPLPVF